MIDTVSALYIDPRGPYPSLVADCWDEGRDAKLYDGPNPVVAHPPCGPWGRLKFLSKHQDPECGIVAVSQVRRWGGVLEHPSNSTLFRHERMPWPGELPDALGGFTVEVNQVAWGHSCAKPTWLYFVGIDRAEVAREMRFGGTPTKRVTNGPRGPQLPRRSAFEARATPLAFAEWLVSLAAAVNDRRAA